MALTPRSAAERELLPDALRGFALFGILVVNIQAFTRGVDGKSLGQLTLLSSGADHIVYLLIAFFAQFKFYPLFALLFGYGFALFWRNAERRGANASALFNARMAWLWVFGALHGIFIWFGDILSRYAIVALLLKSHLSGGRKSLRKAIRAWAIAAVCVAVVMGLLFAMALWMTPVVTLQSDETSATALAQTVHTLYATGSYTASFGQRVTDYLIISFAALYLVPQVLVLFLCGVYAARAGWLRQPARHRAVWRRVLFWSLVVGVPANAIATGVLYADALSHSLWLSVVRQLIDPFVAVQAGAWIALFALYGHHVPGALRWLAAAGRMPLTNYIAQSVICALLLNGFGFGIGADWGQAKLAALALAIYAVQLLYSRAWLSHHTIGPLEAAWRRYTYARQ